MRHRTFLLLAAVLLVVPIAGEAQHSQGCNPLLPAPFGAQDCPKAPPDEPFPQPYVLSGCAYGAFARTTAPLTAQLTNQAPSNFTTAAGSPAVGVSAPCPIYQGQPLSYSNQILGLATPPSSPIQVSAGVLTTKVDAQPGGGGLGTGYSLSGAEVLGLSISIPAIPLTIEADVVRAVAYCTKLAGIKGRNDIGPAGYGPATIVGLRVVTPLGPLPIPAVVTGEDTWISLPGIGGIMLRETWDLENPPYPAASWKSFTENMIHVYLTGPVVGEVVVSHAHCDGLRLEGQAPGEPSD